VDTRDNSDIKQQDLGLNLSTWRALKAEFLDEMELVVPWRELVSLVNAAEKYRSETNLPLKKRGPLGPPTSIWTNPDHAPHPPPRPLGVRPGCPVRVLRRRVLGARR